MQTQPPFRYQQGSGAGQLVNNEPPYYTWTHFCKEADATAFFNKRVKPIVPNAVIQNYTAAEGGYGPSGRPNVGNIQVWVASGSLEGIPIVEYLGALIDAETTPRDGIDDYPLHDPVALEYSPSEQGLVWKHVG